MEFPQKIRFDVFLIVFGLALIFLSNYLSIPAYLLPFSRPIGVIILIYGMTYIKSEYDLELEIKQFEFAKQKFEYLTFFEAKSLISAESKHKQRKDIQNIINI